MTSRIILLVVAGLLAEPSLASADHGLLLAPEALALNVRSSLEDAIRSARLADPSAFDQIARLRRELPELDRNKRGRLVPVSLMLKAMGRRGLMPALERLAVASEPSDELSATARLAWRAGLVEAAGMMRDPRTAPLWRALLDGPAMEPLVMRETVEAYAKLDTGAVAIDLVERSVANGVWREALLAGMGYCRRPLVAQRLAAALDASPTEATALSVAKALGDVGAAASWRLLQDAGRGEESEVRGIAARALVRAHARSSDTVRRMTTKALLIVDHDETPAFIAAARANADAQQGAALDRLLRRFEASPFRRRR